MLTESSFTLHPVAMAAASAAAPAAQPPAAGSQTPATTSHHFSFGDFLDIINPLQHLPIIGTAYRAITHDKIDTPEKIIGDTLYGGVMGLASSVADTLFEKATGHNFGDTILALFTGHHDTQPAQVAGSGKADTKVATTTQASTAPANPPATSASTEESTLTMSLTKSGADSDLAQRALFAYRHANGLTPQTALAPF